MSNTINKYCKQYRLSKNMILKDLTNGEQIKTLSAFENGNSSNIKHLETYIKLSFRFNDYTNFMVGLHDVITGKIPFKGVQND